MNAFVLIVCFVSCGLFGFGIGSLLQQYVLMVLERTPGKNPLGDLGRILTWFLGNGAVGFAMLKSLNYMGGQSVPLADLASVMGYLSGFGVTVGLMFLVSSRFRKSMNKARALTRDRRVAIMLMLLDYEIPIDQVAKSTGLTAKEVATLYQEALTRYGHS